MQIPFYKKLLSQIATLMVIPLCCIKPTIVLAEKKPPTIMEHWSAQVKLDRLEYALQVAKEVTEYYNKNFPSLSGRIYIEKSAEVATVYWFADYQDLDSFRQIMKQLGSDEEFIVLFQKIRAFAIEGTIQQKLLTPFAVFENEQPLADFSRGQDGKIFFRSANSASFKKIFAGNNQNVSVTISGNLSMPNSFSGKVPAVVILHGASGVNAYYQEVAHILNEMGIAAFIVDSLGPRGLTMDYAFLKKIFHSYSIRIADAFAALKLLSTHPRIDKDKIAVMGYSHGAKVALFVSSENIHRSFIDNDLKFAASIAYYPYCYLQFKNIKFTDVPILMLLAEKDNICPVKACLEYTQRLQNSGVNIKTIVYKGAHHQFPVLPDNGLIKVPDLADWSGCGEKQYLFLQDNGTWYSPNMDKTLDEVNVFGEYAANCRIDGEAIIAGNNEAKIESIMEWQSLMKTLFNLP